MVTKISPYRLSYANDVLTLANCALGEGYFDVSKMSSESGLIALSGTVVVGFVLFESVPQAMSLTTIVVDSKWQRRGIGLSLGMESLRKSPGKTWTSPAWISGSDIPADRLLRCLGFEPTHIAKEYWFEDSQKRGYECPICGNPCRCDAMIYRKPANT